MLRRSFVVVSLVGALVVPAGVAWAVASSDDAPAQTTTTVQEQEQQRLRLHDSENCGDQTEVATQTQAQLRQRLQIHDPDESGNYTRMQDGVAAEGGGYGQGVLDGTGPIHDGPADGTGNQLGAGGR